jgi:ribose-phosphate pyrophosphokinase
MRILSLDRGAPWLKILTFPDSQPHVQLFQPVVGDEVMVTCSITSSSKLLQLLELSSILDNYQIKKTFLSIPYLMGARSDRHMVYGDSFDLEVVAKLINSCEFDKVELLDVHSPVALSLINNSSNNKINLLADYDRHNPLFICPDKGAVDRVPEDADVIYCEKSRDLSTGVITLKVNDAEKTRNRNCVIVDDICDGGGTFIAIAKEVRHKCEHLTLAITHGIFSKGFDYLAGLFDEIITTNSYASIDLQDKYSNLKIIKIS